MGSTNPADYRITFDNRNWLKVPTDDRIRAWDPAEAVSTGNSSDGSTTYPARVRESGDWYPGYTLIAGPTYRNTFALYDTNQKDNYTLRARGLTGPISISWPADIDFYAIGYWELYYGVPRFHVASFPTTCEELPAGFTELHRDQWIYGNGYGSVWDLAPGGYPLRVRLKDKILSFTSGTNLDEISWHYWADNYILLPNANTGEGSHVSWLIASQGEARLEQSPFYNEVPSDVPYRFKKLSGEVSLQNTYSPNRMVPDSFLDPYDQTLPVFFVGYGYESATLTYTNPDIFTAITVRIYKMVPNVSDWSLVQTIVFPPGSYVYDPITGESPFVGITVTEDLAAWFCPAPGDPWHCIRIEDDSTLIAGSHITDTYGDTYPWSDPLYSSGGLILKRKLNIPPPYTVRGRDRIIKGGLPDAVIAQFGG